MSLPEISYITFRKLKVFSSKKVTIGTAHDSDSEPRKKYWLVESDEKSALIIRALDEETWLPTGKPHYVTARELHSRYTPESESYAQKVLESLENQKKGLPELPSAPVVAPVVRRAPDEKAFRANFGEGMDLLKQGNLEEAVAIFDNLLHAEIAFEEQHKHLFNDLGIELRKNNLCGQAIAYYSRALELSWGTEDENLHLNLARVLYQNQQHGACVQHIFDSLRISPGNEAALGFLFWLDCKGVIPKQFALRVKGFLTTGTSLQQTKPEEEKNETSNLPSAKEK